MLQKGIVTQISKNMADVEIMRSTACGESCASCGLCPGQTAIVSASNKINAKVGDNVTIDLKNSKILGAAFLVYIVPLIALFAGYFIVYLICGKELLSVLGAFLLMLVTFAFIIIFDKKLKNKYTPKIVSIEDEKND